MIQSPFLDVLFDLPPTSIALALSHDSSTLHTEVGALTITLVHHDPIEIHRDLHIAHSVLFKSLNTPLSHTDHILLVAPR